MEKEVNAAITLQRRQELWLHPLTDLQADYERIYHPDAPLQVGFTGETLFVSPTIRPNTFIVVGGAFGDEGKGRAIDDIIDGLSRKPDIETIWVVRYQGGNNAGHNIEKDGLKLALHVIPSFVLHENARGIMDKGEVIHVEDLQTEVEYVETKLNRPGDLNGRLFLSENAILCTDLERAEEVLNGAIEHRAKGGTKRGISPSYAHFIDRRGKQIRDLVADDWEMTFRKRYHDYQQLFAAYTEQLEGKTLDQVEVPDFRVEKFENIHASRLVGNEDEFIERLRASRQWLIERHLVTDTDAIHRRIHEDHSAAILFEGSQGTGHEPYNGTRPDTTSSNTTVFGVIGGTGHWLPDTIARKLAVIKATYTSSVGVRRMPTHVDASTAQEATEIQQWASWVQEYANEKGTTTGRPRDINILDLEMLRFNLLMSGAQELVLTHLDVAREREPIRICTHYEDSHGNVLPYKPNLADLRNVTPQYIELPGWDGEACRNVKTFDELPLEARQYLAYLQARLGYPITAVTTGPDRENFISLPGYN